MTSYFDTMVEHEEGSGDSRMELDSLMENEHVKYGMLWRILKERDKNTTMMMMANVNATTAAANESSLRALGIRTSWDLVVIQIILLCVLVMIALIWAYFCRGGGSAANSNLNTISGTVASIARKLSNTSKDLPPSYSRVDLTSVGLSIQDALNPPPSYESAFTLEHTSGTPTSPAQTVIRAVTFSNPLSERLTPGPRRQLSVQSLPANVTSILSNPQRKRSVASEGSAGSRRVSFIEEPRVLVIQDEEDDETTSN